MSKLTFPRLFLALTLAASLLSACAPKPNPVAGQEVTRVVER